MLHPTWVSRVANDIPGPGRYDLEALDRSYASPTHNSAIEVFVSLVVEWEEASTVDTVLLTACDLYVNPR